MLCNFENETGIWSFLLKEIKKFLFGFGWHVDFLKVLKGRKYLEKSLGKGCSFETNQCHTLYRSQFFFTQLNILDAALSQLTTYLKRTNVDVNEVNSTLLEVRNELTLRCWHYRSIQAVVLSSTFASNSVVSNYDETF